ncbi:chromatin remodeling regulator CECR2-like [Uloborus diversus]|uniref:chromatin remodeling regulator CECR2-like n=1 Tax=Uloborus diversus TaxID=327109 RepID=UPI00240A8838|nr:chromatin remodeling regulator CECR2-like [Uloborus diversus]
MEEVQSWWEVPSVAHFCYVFRHAFNLFYIEIGELEAAILNIQDPEMCISLEQLMMRLLQGCYDAESVTTENWEEKLKELFEDNCEDEENPLMNNCSFYTLTPKNKVEILMKLCEFRLDADGALEDIKDIPSEDMQAKCIGKDGHNNSYWYFCDERLYKEKNSDKVDMKKNTSLATSKKSKKEISNSRRQKEKNPSNNNNNLWSIACYSISDWEKLAKSFSKSKNSDEKELSNIIKSKYLSFLQEVVSEKDAILRKRFLELAPKRSSSRISKVQAQRKMEEQKAFEAAEKARIKFAEEQERKEVERKKMEKLERQKRAEERRKAVEERALRAQARDLVPYPEKDDSQSKRIPGRKRGRPSKNSGLKKQRGEYSSSEESKSGDGSDEESDQNESDIKESDSDESDCENESETVCNSKPVHSNNLRQSSASNCVLINKINGTQFARQTIQSSCNSTPWTSTVDSRGRKTLIFKDSNHLVANTYSALFDLTIEEVDVDRILRRSDLRSP